MEFGLKGTSRVCRGRHGEVGEWNLRLPKTTKIIENTLTPTLTPVLSLTLTLSLSLT